MGSGVQRYSAGPGAELANPLEASAIVGRRCQNASFPPWIPRQVLRLRVARWFVEGEVAEEIGEFLGGDLFFELLGHHRDFADLVDLDLVTGNRLQLAALDLENHALLGLFDGEAGEDAAIGGLQDTGLVRTADDEGGLQLSRPSIFHIRRSRCIR